MVNQALQNLVAEVIPDKNEWGTIEEVAEALKGYVSISTLRSWIYKDLIITKKFGGRVYLNYASLKKKMTE